MNQLFNFLIPEAVMHNQFMFAVYLLFIFGVIVFICLAFREKISSIGPFIMGKEVNKTGHQLVFNIRGKLDELYTPIKTHCKASLKQRYIENIEWPRDQIIYLDCVDWAFDYRNWTIFKKRLMINHFSKVSEHEKKQEIQAVCEQFISEFKDRLSTRIHGIQGVDINYDFNIPELYDMLETAIKQWTQYKTEICKKTGFDYDKITQTILDVERGESIMVPVSVKN